LNIELKNSKFKAQKGSLRSSGIEADCSPGMEWRDDKCLACSAGSFFNKEAKKCEECPVNTFNSLDKQEKCSDCPLGFYQKKTGKKFCEPCPRGYFGKNCEGVCPCANGICSLETDQCTCEVGWKGRYCNQAISSCKKNSCGHPNVVCSDVKPPNTGFTCGRCPKGYVGDGYTCEMMY